jgi:hypothetical protein
VAARLLPPPPPKARGVNGGQIRLICVTHSQPTGEYSSPRRADIVRGSYLIGHLFIRRTGDTFAPISWRAHVSYFLSRLTAG